MRVTLFAYGTLGMRVLETLGRLGQNGLQEPTRIVCVHTHPDAVGERLWFASVAKEAEGLGVPVQFAKPHVGYRPDSRPNPETDIIVSAGFRSPIKASFFKKAKFGAYNLHPSLLPRYRGRSPVNWAILSGERKVGLTLHHMVEEIDAGPIVVQRALSVGPDELVASVVARLDQEIEPLFGEVWPLIVEGRAPAIPQDPALAEYFGGRRPEDGRLDWSWPARRLHNLIRAVSEPFPGAFCERHGRRIFVWETRVLAESSPGVGTGISPGHDRFLIGTGEGLLEVLRCSVDDGPECPGSGLSALW